jgi:TonB family protein
LQESFPVSYVPGLLRFRGSCYNPCAMKLGILFIAILVISSLAYSQSGRRAKPITSPVPAPAEEPKPSPKTAEQEPPPVTAEKNQDYRCTDDNGLARILDAGDATEKIVSSKEADERAQITRKPQPDYTREARRNGIQGFVTLKVLLSADGKVSRIRVMKGLPAGLTESAIRAACKIQFKPAMKDGQPASMWVIAEYIFRTVDSSIFRP